MPSETCFDDISGKLKRFQIYLNEERGITIPFELIDGGQEHWNLFNILNKLYLLCKKEQLPFHINWLYILHRLIVGNMNHNNIKVQGRAFPGYDDRLEPIFREVKAGEITWPSDFVIIVAKGITGLSGGPDGVHGLTTKINGNSNNLVVLIKDYAEIIFHEFLHLFGVSDGYHDEFPDKRTNPGCEQCWMQWEPCKGYKLCDSHSDELIYCSPLIDKRC